jgi:hypothetical protein
MNLTEINAWYPEVIYELLGIFDLRSRILKIIIKKSCNFLNKLYIVCELNCMTSNKSPIYWVLQIFNAVLYPLRGNSYINRNRIAPLTHLHHHGLFELRLL